MTRLHPLEHGFLPVIDVGLSGRIEVPVLTVHGVDDGVAFVELEPLTSLTACIGCRRNGAADNIRAMECCPHFAACCTAPSVTTAIPGLLLGRAACERCRRLERPERLAVCVSLRPSAEICGASGAQAMAWLDRLERQTSAAGAT